MTQKDLIEKLKLELSKDFNENASFLVTQPLFKDMTVGLKKDELVNGIYVTLLDKNQTPMLDGNAFYFKVTDPEQYCAKLYSAQWKKYMFPLSKLEDWSNIIVFGRSVLQRPLTPDDCYPLEVDPIIEEFPIQKIQGKTTYSKRNSFIVIGKDSGNENIILQDLAGKEIAHTKESFSDLVDLMIEARKDLLK